MSLWSAFRGWYCRRTYLSHAHVSSVQTSADLRAWSASPIRPALAHLVRAIAALPAQARPADGDFRKHGAGLDRLSVHAHTRGRLVVSRGVLTVAGDQLRLRNAYRATGIRDHGRRAGREAGRRVRG